MPNSFDPSNQQRHSSLCSLPLRSLRTLRFNHSNTTGIDIIRPHRSSTLAAKPEQWPVFRVRLYNRVQCDCRLVMKGGRHLKKVGILSRCDRQMLMKLARRIAMVSEESQQTSIGCDRVPRFYRLHQLNHTQEPFATNLNQTHPNHLELTAILRAATNPKQITETVASQYFSRVITSPLSKSFLINKLTCDHPLAPLIHLPSRSQQNLVHVHALGLRQRKPNRPRHILRQQWPIRCRKMCR